MDNLLNRAKQFGGGLLTMIDRLGTANVMHDPALDELAGGPGAAIAAEAARRQGLAAMLQPGLPWYAMGVARDAAGQDTYNSSISSAVKTAEQVRQMRADKKRREALAEWIAGAPKLTRQDGKPQFSDAQISGLEALSPDEQAKVLSKQLFPELDSQNVATAGQINSRTKLPNGNLGIIVQTGDPSQPWAIDDTGIPYYEQAPSVIRTADGLIADPSRVAAIAGLEGEKTLRQETEKVNVAFDQMAGPALQAAYSDIANYDRLLAQVKGMGTGPVTGAVMAKLSADFQLADSRMKMAGLSMIAELKSRGISLTPITERELAILMQPTPQLSNYAEANVAIIGDRVRSLKSIVAVLESQLAFREQGGDITKWRPAKPGTAPTAAPAAAGPRQPLPADQREF